MRSRRSLPVVSVMLWSLAVMPVVCFSAPPAAAQGTPAQGIPAAGAPVPRFTQLRRQVVKACPIEYAKLCPGQETTDGRSMAICLKAYMSDLSLNCRGAVRALVHPPAPVTPG